MTWSDQRSALKYYKEEGFDFALTKCTDCDHEQVSVLHPARAKKLPVQCVVCLGMSSQIVEEFKVDENGDRILN